MRPLLLFVLALFSSFSLNASHLWGGDITWECQGNGSYIFRLTLYRDCTGITLPTTNQNIDGPTGSITCTFVNKQAVLFPCFNASQYDCSGTVPIVGPVERYIYESAPVALSGTPPSSGWEFSYSSCCRAYMSNSGSAGIHISSLMYPGSVSPCASSPEFTRLDAIYSAGNGFIANTATKGHASDSLYYNFADPQLSSGTVITFDSGYSAAAPFPDTSESSLNGPISIDHNTGTVALDIHPNYFSTPELFVYAVAVETWRAGSLLSKVNREMVLVAYDSASITHNNAPIVNANTANLGLPYSWLASNKLRVLAQPGDTLSFDLLAVDAEFNNNGMGQVPQQIRFRWRGFAFDAARSGFSNVATVSPVSPQSGFVSTISNSINFQWAIASEHAIGSKSSYFFSLLFTDDACPGGKTSFIDLEVVVSKPQVITPDTVQVCQGDSVQLGGNTPSGTYQWSPNLEISNVSVAAPWVKPTISRYYYLSDPANASIKDSVYVDLVQRKVFRLDTAANLISLVDSVQSGLPVWYYNGIPFTNPYDTLTPFGPGYYWVELTTPTCKYRTDTVTYMTGSLSLADPSNGMASTTPLALTGSWSAVFSLDQNAHGSLNEILIPGIIDLSGKTGGYDLTLEIMDGGGQVVYRIDTNVAMLNGMLMRLPANPAISVLQPGQSYALTLTGDTGYAFSYYSNVQLPATPWNQGLTITAMDIDGAPTGNLIPVVLSVTNPVGLVESDDQQISIYPNPADDLIRIEGLEVGSQVSIMDVTGKILITEELSASGELHIHDLDSGVYLLEAAGVVQKFQVR
jgi:hypothetical protein